MPWSFYIMHIYYTIHPFHSGIEPIVSNNPTEFIKYNYKKFSFGIILSAITGYPKGHLRVSFRLLNVKTSELSTNKRMNIFYLSVGFLCKVLFFAIAEPFPNLP